MVRYTILAAISMALSTAACAGEGDGILDQFPPVTPVPTPVEGAAVLTGNLDGSIFTPLYAFSDRSVSELSGVLGAVMLTPDPDMCTDWNNQAIQYGATFLAVEVFLFDGSDASAPTEPGVHEIGGSGERRAQVTYYEVSDTECGTDKEVLFESGNVDLELVLANRYGGIVVGTTEGGEDVEAAFNPLPCSGIEYFYNGDGVFCR